jgi:hypothetical protein
MNAEVHNNPTENRYEVWADGELAGYAQYGLGRGRITFATPRSTSPTKAWAAGWPGRRSTRHAPRDWE